MFFNFGKKSSCIKKPASPAKSPKTASPSGLSTPASGSNIGPRSTVLTTAGPLLSSSRFNTILDASTYANVNSPGFTSRVVNCASSGGTSYNDNCETHQSKYSSVGLFPSVQLKAHSILPTLSSRNSQKVRTPVRVRIAPPSLIDRRRHSISCVPTDVIIDKTDSLKRSPSLTHQNPNKESSTPSTKTSESITSVLDHFQEASRKRIFSDCQDACDEAKKRRRKVELPIPNPNNDTYHYRHVRVPAVPSSPPQPDITSQGKRAREKGSPEEQKRQRRKVCNKNNAIFSSLSSSRNLLERLTAQKRKSVDTSRSSSPLTPLCGKQVKESKTVTDAKAVQCDLGSIPQQTHLSEASQQHATPVSSKTISKKATLSAKEISDNLIKSSCNEYNESPQTSTCDYTTKLFRKDVSHTHRTPTSKTPKQSSWIKPPEADELTCSLLNDDSKLHRPERLRSLLACVSGKDNVKEAIVAISSAPASFASTIITLPVSSSLKPLSPSGARFSSALTVTVSSTSTIMTSATVTSVSGVPSSEDGRSPPPVSAPSSAAFSLSSQPVASTSVQSPIKAPSLPQTTGANLGQATSLSGGSQPHALGQTATTSTSLFNPSNSLTPSAGFTEKRLGTPTLNTSKEGLGTPTFSTSKEGVNTTPSMFSFKSPVNSSGSSQAIGSAETSKPAFQLGSASSNTTPAHSMFQFGSNVQSSTINTPSRSTTSTTPTAATSSAFQITSSLMSPASSPTLLGSNSGVPKPSFSFGSSSSGFSGTGSSGDPKPAFQLGEASKSVGTDPSTAAKPAFSFGSSTSASSEEPKSAFQFGSSGNSALGTAQSTFPFASSGTSINGPTGTPKPTFALGSSGTSSTASLEASKPALQFGSSGNGLSAVPNAAFQFGSSGTSSNVSPAPQFGSTAASTHRPAEAQKSALQFGVSGTGSHGISNSPKPAFQFTSASHSLSATPKPGLQFGPSSNATFQTPNSAPSFGSTNGGLAAPSKSAFQFGTSSSGPSGNSGSTFHFGSPAHGSADATKSPFQFASSANKPTNLSQPTFGSPSLGSTSAFGHAAPQESKAAFSFGTAATPNNNGNSGNENKSAFSFGTSGPTFGSTSSNSPFGSSPASSAFGAPTTNSQSTLPPFGSVTNSKSNGFGSTPNFGSTGPSTFSFSSNSSSGTGNSFQPSGANASSNSGAFAFGQNQNQAPPSFSFNASVTAVPNPSAQANQAPGLFSIGAGSTSTQRRVRDARRRR